MPQIQGADLSSTSLGKSWGHTRSWSGLNNASRNGNGWSVAQLPYVVVAGGIFGTDHADDPNEDLGDGNGVFGGTEDDDRLTAVFGGLDTYSFTIPTSSPYTSYAAWGSQRNTLQWISGDGVLRLTDSAGNVTDFYDVKRDGNNRPIAWSRALDVDLLYGQFKRFTAADGSTVIEAHYSDGTTPGYPDGYLMDVTRKDSTGTDIERYFYTYTTVNNHLSANATLISNVKLQHKDGGGTWQTARQVDYTYYTGFVADGADPGTDPDPDPNGRLGDLKFAEVKDGSGNLIDASYYRYYKLTGEGHYSVSSQGPTNDMETTGGPEPLVDNPFYDDVFVNSGLKTVVTGAAFARLAAAVPGYQTATDSAIEPYVNHYFEYERWGDHVGTGAGDNYYWRTGYRFGSRYRVTKEVAQGTSCSTCYGGAGTYKYEYAASYDTTDIGFETIQYNTWRMRTIEYLPDTTPLTWADNDRNVVYTNELGQVILSALVDVADVTRDAELSWQEEEYDWLTVTLEDHGFLVGDTVFITGAIDTYFPRAAEDFNGYFRISEIDTENGDWFKIEGVGDYRGGYDRGAIECTAKVTKVDRMWRTFYQYDDEGRLILKAHPSAVTGPQYDYSPNLLNEGATSLSDLEGLDNDDGLIEVFTYFDGTTTATATAAGNVDGYLQSTGVRHGESGTLILSTSQQYYKRVADQTTYPVATQTKYFKDHNNDTDNYGAQTTTYTYEWYGSDSRMKSKTTLLPVVSTGSNGPGSGADTETVFYDTYGRPIWTKDAGGYITYTAYDASTGAVVKRIVDVKYSLLTSGEQDSFGETGWTQPSSGLHLTTTYEADGLGRTTKETDPNGNLTYTVYKDASHETRIYRGWTGTTTTSPIEIYREYRSGTPVTIDGYDVGRVYTEFLTVSAKPTTSSGKPTGAETINEVNIQSLTRRLTNDAGQVVAVDAYFSLAGVTYSQATVRLGTASNDSSAGSYHKTLQAYDGRGRLKRVEAATGTVTRYLYDARGNLTETWVGTDDTDDNPGNGTIYWSPATATDTEFNLVKIESRQYDNGGLGNGNLTKTTQYPGGGATDRVTEMHYDWRDRLVLSKSGVQTTEDDGALITYLQYNNQDQVRLQELYAGDGVTVTYSSGVPNAPDAFLRRGRTVTAYDEQGRVYRTTVYGVLPEDQGTLSGTISTYGLSTDTFYDGRGNVIKTSAPGGLVTKYEYDGVGRNTKVYQTDGGSDTTYAHALTVDGDVVLTQKEFTYDKNGNLTLELSRQRYHDAATTLTGAIGNPSSSGSTAKARVYGTAYQYDRVNRVTVEMNLGTMVNGHTGQSTTAGGNQSLVDASRTEADHFAQWYTIYITGGTGAGQVATVQDYDADTHMFSVSWFGIEPDATSTYVLMDPGTLWRTYEYSFDEQQTVELTGTVTGGTFTLNFNGQSTSAIAYNANATTVRNALAALSTIGSTSNVSVTSISAGVWYVSFSSALGRQNVSQITATSSLTGTSPGVSTTTTMDGGTGNVMWASEPSGNGSVYYYDLLGRRTKSIAVWEDMVPSADTDQTTQWTYDGAGHILTTKAVLPAGTFQETKYIYGVGSSGNLYSNDLLAAVQYPHKSTGSASSGEQETFTYNALGQRKTYSDRNGTTHTYTYDVLGRITADTVTTLGSGVDGAVRQLAYTYDSAGRARDFTSLGINQLITASNLTRSGATATATLTAHGYTAGDYVTISGSTAGPFNGTFLITSATSNSFTFTVANSGATTAAGTISVREVVNQVRNTYNGLGQLIVQTQNTAGAIAGPSATTKGISYVYSEMEGGANHSRLVSLNYSSATIYYDYYDLDDSISRVSTLGESAGGDVSFKYTGLGDAPSLVTQTIYMANYHTAAVTKNLTVDRFGRIATQQIVNSITSTTETQYYTYDANSNVTASYVAGRQNVYSYDALNRLTDWDYGNPNGSHDGLSGSPLGGNDWTLDSVGNWLGGSGDGLERTHNAQNQIADRDSSAVAYDANGNLEDDQITERTYAYDAWNRLVFFDRVDTAEGTYAYDALGRRVVEIVDDGVTIAERRFYYSKDWQVLDEFDGSGEHLLAENVWSPHDMSTLLFRDVDTDDDPNTGDYGQYYSGLDQRTWVIQDITNNVVGLIEDSDGSIIATIAYDPYGTAIATAGAIPTDWQFLFQGHRFDADANLYDFRNRVYDPTLGRFMQRDPIGYADGPSLYQAMRSNPTSFVDPNGTISWACVSAALWCAGGIIGLPAACASGVLTSACLAAIIGGAGAGCVACLDCMPDWTDEQNDATVEWHKWI